MMHKSLHLYGAILALFASQVSAHAAIDPALGVQGNAVRNDVQRPSNNSPCGNVNIASAIDTSKAVTADASGAFTVDIQNFNGGRDGSRQVTMKVNADGKGANFVNAQVTVNGDAAPSGVGTQKITASLPAGTKCTGGASGNKCLASFTTLGGFGNCVVVQQGAGGGNAANANAGAAANGNANNGNKNNNANNGNAGNANANANANNAGKAKAAGNGKAKGNGRAKGQGRGRGRGRFRGANKNGRA
ncbi:hypothetical protein NLU13_8225 [Sarocladium strictum]|uniref:Uncharacterized protein n=1 Tax=Sarocladium strictum TaxID=5046 RepID=A0AA39L4F6_SARSR|nr:hypothetical protein NLU13_8225 [Sarocladium strictum]